MFARSVSGLGLLLITLAALGADDDKWSVVKGKVVFDDSKNKIPKRVLPPAAAKVAALPPCAAKDKEFLTEEWIVNPTTKAVKDVVVWLAPEPTAAELAQLKAKGKERLKDFPNFKVAQIHPDLQKLKQKTVEIDQPCCRFIPHVSAMRLGQTLVIKNSADFAHNAKYFTSNNGEENPLIPPGGQHQIPITKPERAEIKITCNIHGWMFASVRVFDHPYFAVTNADGEYEIKNAPVGKHRIFIWHPEGAYFDKVNGGFGYELDIKPKLTEVKTYSVTLGKPDAK
jgi:hypothetical protein